MKKHKKLLAGALILAAVLVVCFLLTGRICIGRIESRTEEGWLQLHHYMNGSHTVTFPVSEDGQIMVFQWETGRGSFSAEITDAEGKVLLTSDGSPTGADVFEADSDLTLRIHAKGHGGVFALFPREDPLLLDEEPGNEPEPYIAEDGLHSGDTFTATYRCRRFDGKYLNFYVENNGDSPVVITINGESKRIIEPDTAGHIKATISATVAVQELTVKCKSQDGEAIDIYWKVAQRHHQ